MDFDEIDKVIHEKGRLAIMTMLATRSGWAFQDLKAELNMSDGNLVSHLRTLHQSGYVAYTKDIPLRPKTTYMITPKGRAAFRRYIDLLETLIKKARS